MSWLDSLKRKPSLQQADCSYYMKCGAGSPVIHIRDARDSKGETLCGQEHSEDICVLTSMMYFPFVYDQDNTAFSSQRCAKCVEGLEAIMRVS